MGILRKVVQALKTYILIYEGFAQFEVVLTGLIQKSVGDVITVGLDNKMVTSEEGFQTVPHMVLSDMELDQVDLFVIPGGDPNTLGNHEALFNCLRQLDEKNIPIAAICAGPVQLAKAGIIKNRNYTTSVDIKKYEGFQSGHYKNENVVVDNHVITAKGAGYVDFAIEIGKVLDVYENEADLQETINFFKYFQAD